MMAQLGGSNISSQNMGSGSYKHKRSVELPVYDYLNFTGSIVEVDRMSYRKIQDLPVYDSLKMEGKLIPTLIDKEAITDDTANSILVDNDLFPTEKYFE